nr:Tab2 family RNA-binding protein [Chroococcidiopsis sp. SAG 2025]
MSRIATEYLLLQHPRPYLAPYKKQGSGFYSNLENLAQIYAQRQQQSQGLHFLLVQPDDSGMTYTGFWLLRDE